MENKRVCSSDMQDLNPWLEWTNWSIGVTMLNFWKMFATAIARSSMASKGFYIQAMAAGLSRI